MLITQIKAITVNESDEHRLAIRTVDLVPALQGEITIRVTAISLNRGETRRALTTSVTGTRPGWDFSGIVEDTNGVAGAPSIGTRVVGLLAVGSWCERVHAPLSSISVIPEGITNAQAVCLPLAGLTALHAIRKGGFLLGKKVLINGASGGVGQMAIQLASAAGAVVYSHIRQANQKILVAGASTGAVIIGDSLDEAKQYGPFDFILDSLGGAALSAALGMLKKNGTCITIGASESSSVTFDSNVLFFSSPGASLRSMVVFDEISAAGSMADDLALLLNLVKQGKLKINIGAEANWTEIATVAKALIDREFTGKAVLHLPQLS
ncbi:zinc-binding dehydrogenase [Pedobacter sp. L105]|uniref:zinc-binding dehydrogenase n=1 Tax=Pedobacter sp. L105 TaxID=1641871 RepID=UPI00131B801C|nr:zinc-binding dehydrogenase [Pedobacter sp. L105]